jgi:hypothetical protein
VLGILTKYDLLLIKLSELAEHQDKIITLPLYISFLCALYIAKSLFLVITFVALQCSKRQNSCKYIFGKRSIYMEKNCHALFI